MFQGLLVYMYWYFLVLCHQQNPICLGNVLVWVRSFSSERGSWGGRVWTTLFYFLFSIFTHGMCVCVCPLNTDTHMVRNVKSEYETV